MLRRRLLRLTPHSAPAKAPSRPIAQMIFGGQAGLRARPDGRAVT